MLIAFFASYSIASCVADRNIDLLVALLWCNNALVCKTSVDFCPFPFFLYFYYAPLLIRKSLSK